MTAFGRLLRTVDPPPSPMLPQELAAAQAMGQHCGLPPPLLAGSRDLPRKASAAGRAAVAAALFAGGAVARSPGLREAVPGRRTRRRQRRISMAQGPGLLVERLLYLLAPKEPEPKAMNPQAASKIRSVVQSLQRHAQAAEVRAAEAERARDEAVAQAQAQKSLMQDELERVGSMLKAMQRYAEELEEERDGARDELELLRRARVADAMRLAEVARSMGGGFLCEARGTPPGAGAHALRAPLEEANPSEMDQWALQVECQRRGLADEGSLAMLRSRVRAARAKERREVEVAGSSDTR